MDAIGVAVRIEVGDRGSSEVRRGREWSDECDQLVPVQPERLWVTDGGQHCFIEDIEVEP